MPAVASLEAARAALDRGAAAAAAALLEESLALVPVEPGERVYELARARLATGQARQALIAALDALRSLRAAGAGRGTLGLARNVLGMTLAAIGRNRWALAAYVRAESDLAESGDAEGAAMARNNRGTIHYLLGEPDRALDLQIEALSTLRALGVDPRRIATGLRNVGAALHKLGRFDAALTKVDAALALLDPANPAHRPAIGPLILNRGAARERLGDLPAAEADYRAALALAREDGGPRGRAATADAAWHLAAVLAERGAVVEGEELARSAIVDSLRAERPDLLWRCLNRAARFAIGWDARILLGKIAAGVLWAEARRLAGVASIGQARFLEGRVHAFAELTADLIDAGRLAEAFAVGAATDRLSVTQCVPARWLPPETVALSAREAVAIARWRALAAALAARPDDPSALAALDTWLRAPLAEFSARVEPTTRPRRSAGSPDEIRVQFAVGVDRLRIIASANGEVGVVRAIEMSSVELARAVYEFARACRRGVDIDAVQRLGQPLYERLIAPVIAELPDPPPVLAIVADGPLRVLPWAALWTGEGYLGERWAIEILCGGIIALPRAGARIAIFAAGAADEAAIALPGAAREAEAIAALHSALRDGPWIDAAFTRARLSQAVAGGAARLHVASHFALDPADLSRSRLRLGDGSTMTAAAFAALDLAGMEEIVLSACESGLPAGEAAGDAKSLPDLFAACGVAHSVAALWPVPDGTTAELMFAYHAARRDGLTPARALALAQRASIRTTGGGPSGAARGIGDVAPEADPANPRAWAGFQAFRTVAPGGRDAE